MTESTEPRKRGRPRKPDALTPAERMRRYRARKKAGLVKPKSVTGDGNAGIGELKARIANLEAQVVELEAENERLRNSVTGDEKQVSELEARIAELEASTQKWMDQAMKWRHDLDVALAHNAKLKQDLERNRQTHPIYLRSDNQCQARTQNGKRCRHKGAALIRVESGGFAYQMHVCTQHLERHRGRRSVVPAYEFLPE